MAYLRAGTMGARSAAVWRGCRSARTDQRAALAYRNSGRRRDHCDGAHPTGGVGIRRGVAGGQRLAFEQAAHEALD